MQDRWAADAGDFLKFATLRAVSCVEYGEHLPLGLVWYYRQAGHDHEASTGPARPPSNALAGVDPWLFDCLARVGASSERSVRRLLAEGVLSTAVSQHYLEPMPERRGRSRSLWEARSSWHKAAMRAVRGCETVFLDPDNGLQPDEGDRKDGTRTRLPHVLWGELHDHWQAGRSLIVFQHANRRTEWIERGGQRLAVRLPARASVLAISNGPVCLYVAGQERHRASLEQAVKSVASRTDGLKVWGWW